MINITNNIRKPYYTALVKINIFSKNKYNQSNISIYEKLVSCAPGQPGFLGLETKEYSQGLYYILFYWKNLKYINAWQIRAETAFSPKTSNASPRGLYQLKITKITKNSSVISKVKKGLNPYLLKMKMLYQNI